MLLDIQVCHQLNHALPCIADEVCSGSSSRGRIESNRSTFTLQNPTSSVVYSASSNLTGEGMGKR